MSSGKYIYFNSGGGADATTEALCFTAESFRGMDTGSSLVSIYFEPITDRTEANHAKVQITVADGSQGEVMIAIAEAIATMNAGILTIFDGDNSLALHSKSTAIAAATVSAA